MERRSASRHVRAFSTSLPSPATHITTRPPSATATLVAVLVSAFVSLSFTLLNRFMLSSSEFRALFSLAIAAIQLIMAVTVLELARWLGLRRLVDEQATTPVIPSKYIDWEAARHAMPASVAYTVMIVLNTVALRYVNVASFQMARYASVLFAVALTPLLLYQAVPMRILAVVVISVAGCLVEQAHSLFYTSAGLWLALASGIAIAVYSVIAKRSLIRLGNSVWRLLRYMLPMAAAQLCPVAIFSGELSALFNVYFIRSFGFWLIAYINSATGLAITAALLFQLRYTTPITSIVATSARMSIQTALVVILASGPVGWQNGVAIVACVGALAYCLHAQQQQQQQQQQQWQKRQHSASMHE
ncbi:hypothetical protein THASP1DRAFT_30663 [Thamnocephalis sphaerospora]|uniref:Sugar phosphate transporter domain-containing protein n=1 Tax=Thamnocephalis sphaerospora TaxID=78915 RepID=A0A4V1IWG9_9FUNG|nr:hypothetical protein THASP1DRAFT_30663 [Thamnocephalis sphaerospora]|eukprot:RKP07519.1 hypothetical protein THASP1DRAFT_30663 [Thamnocephalis sphaerospora]